MASNNRSREWKKYHNKQLYQECQLVTTLNAYYYLTGKVIKQDTKQYEKFVDMCMAREGAAINIGAVREKLGMEIIKEYPNKYKFTNVFPYFEGKLYRPKLPVEVHVWHQDCGYHSVLIVDHSPKVMAIRVTNFRHLTNKHGWVFTEDFMHYIKESVKKDDWCARTYGVKK